MLCSASRTIQQVTVRSSTPMASSACNPEMRPFFPLRSRSGPWRIVGLTNVMTYDWTDGTGAVWWEDTAMGLSNAATGCQISWGGFTQPCAFQITMTWGPLVQLAVCRRRGSRHRATSAPRSGDFFVGAGDVISVVIKHAYESLYLTRAAPSSFTSIHWAQPPALTPHHRRRRRHRRVHRRRLLRPQPFR